MMASYPTIETLEDRLLLSGDAPVVNSLSPIRLPDGRVSAVSVSFSEDLSASLDAADLVLTNATTDQPIDTSSAYLIVDGLTATWLFGIFPGSTLADGDYEGSLTASGIVNAQQVALDGDGDGTGGDDYVFSFRNYGYGSTGGTVFYDLDGDSLYDPAADLPLADVRVFDDADGDGAWDAGELYGVSDADGAWRIAQLMPGEFVLTVELPDGWVADAPAGGARAVSLVSDQNAGDLDYSIYLPDSIAGMVYQDIGGDGGRDAGDVGLSGWTVFLDADGDGALDVDESSTVTDADGGYLFESLAAGDYELAVVTPSGWTQTAPAAGSHTVSLAAGQGIAGRDFGARADATGISGTVYDDADADGVYDAGEDPLSGWVVFLDADADGELDLDEAWMLSGADGGYNFPDLGPGVYTVAAASRAGWDRTSPVGAVSASMSFVQVLSDADDGLGEMVRTVKTVVSADGAHVYTLARGGDIWSLYVFAVDAASGALSLVQHLSELDIPAINGASDIVFGGDGLYAYLSSAIEGTIAIFSRNSLSGELSYLSEIAATQAGLEALAGAGAMAFSDGAAELYVAGATSNSLSVFTRSALTGMLSLTQTHTDGRLGVDGLGGAADVVISPDGCNVYVAGAADEAIAVFTRDTRAAAQGALKFTQTIDATDMSAGALSYLSALAVSPDGRTVYAAAAGSGCVAVFERQISNGRLSFRQALLNQSGGVVGIDYPTDVAVSPDGLQVIVTGSLDYAFAEFARAADGTLSLTAAVVDEDGGGAMIPDIRTATFSPDGRGLYLSGASGSQIMVYAYPAREAHLVELQAAQAAPGLNFGFAAQSGKITGVVFLDSDGDGVQDAGETGLSGWTVYIDDGLSSAEGFSSPAVQTDADGVYAFSPLASGLQSVQLVMPTGWVNTTPGGSVYLLELAPGEQLGGVNFGAVLPASISGHVFEDDDRDGARGASEAPLAGATVFIDENYNGLADSGEPQVFAAADGSYRFDDLTAGVYRVGIALESGLVISSPISGGHTVMLATGQAVTNLDFGAYRLGSLAGTLWHDLDGDAAIGDGEDGLADWTVFIDADGDGSRDAAEPAATTDAQGNYSFENLAPGAYTLRVVVQSGWRALSSVGRSLGVSLTSGAALADIDFPIVQPVNVSGIVWHDGDGDGLVGDDDAALEGWTVWLDANANGLLDAGEATAQTTVSGYYEFAEADPGAHSIAVETPEGWWACDPESGVRQIAATSGGVFANINFGLRPGVEFDRDGKARYIDPDGVKIVVTSTRQAAGRLYFDTRGYVSELYVIPADGRGEITVVTSGTEMLFVNDIVVPGTITSLIAPTLGLSGGAMTLDGTLDRLRLGDVRDARILFNQAGLNPDDTAGLIIDLGSVRDASLDTGGAPIRSLTVDQWLDADGRADAIAAPAIETLAVTGAPATAGGDAVPGDMQADLVLDGGDAGTPSNDTLLGRAEIAGSLSGDWSINGDAGRIGAGDIDAFTLDVAGDGQAVRADAIATAEMTFDGALGELQAEQWTAGSLTADSAGPIRMTGNRGEAVAGDFGADLDLPGAGLLDGDEALRRIDVAGDVTGGTWTINGSLGLINVSGAVGDLTATVLGALGELSAGSVSATDLGVRDEIGRIVVSRWLDGSIAADTLGLLKTTGDRAANLAGDFSGDLTLDADNPLGSPLAARQIVIAGNVDGGTWDMGEGVDAVIVLGDIANLAATIAGPLSDLSAGSVSGTSLAAEGPVGRIVVTDWLDGSLAADSVNLLKTTGDRATGAPGDFGADLTLPAATFDSADRSARQILISGDLTGGAWNLGGDVNDVSVGGDVSGLDAAIAGDLGSFSAGSLSDADLAVDGGLDRVIVTRWLGGSISADALGLLKSTGDRRIAIDGDFAADLAVNDLVRQIFVAGSASDAAWDLSGGVVALIILGDLSGMDMRIGGSLNSFNAASVSESDLTVDGDLGRVNVDAWLGGAISADSLDALIAGSARNGDADAFSADLTLGGQSVANNRRTLGRAAINGNLPGGAWDVTGDLGPVDVLGDVTGWTLSGGDVASFRAAEVTDSTLEASGDLGAVVADQWTGGAVNAASLAALKITGDRRNAIDGDFSGALAIDGDGGRVNIAGSVDGGSWQIGGSQPNIVVGGDATDLDLSAGSSAGSRMGKLLIVGSAVNVQVRCGGTISAIVLGACVGSDFLAGVDPSVPRRHVEYSDDFTDPEAIIGPIVISGLKVGDGQSDRFVSDSHFSAPRIANVVLRNADQAFENVGFFVTNGGPEVRSIRYLDTLQRNWGWTPRKAAFPGTGNVFVRPVGESFSPVVTPAEISINEGGQNTVQVTLSSDPIVETAVTVAWSSGDGDLSVVDGAELVFDADNWNVPQTVTLAAAEDLDSINGWADFTVTADGGYNPATLRVNESDDDQPFELLVSAPSLDVDESSAGQISVTLSSAPLGTVVATVTRTGGDADLAVSFGSTLVFDWSNWDTPHVILIVAAADADAIDGSAEFTISAAGALADATFTVNEIDAG